MTGTGAHHARPSRRAFTLVELLVVIGVIGILIGLLLPAVQKVRSAAHRVRCMNNLRQLSVALLGYESTNERFPSYFDDRGIGPTWVTYILPYIEQPAIYQRYNFGLAWYDSANQPATTASIPVLVCTAAPGPRSMKPWGGISFPPIDYVPNIGVDPGPILSGMVPGPLNLEHSGAIVPKQVYDTVTMQMVEMSTRVTDVTDGTSQTILLNEVAGGPQLWQAGKYVANYESIGISIYPPYPTWASPEHWMHLDSYDYTGTVTPGPCSINCTNLQEIYSFHQGGAMIAFVDGHVQFANENINIVVMAALITRNGGEAISDPDY